LARPPETAERFADARPDLAAYVRPDGDAVVLSLLVDGMTCGGCVARIERTLAPVDGVLAGRANLTTRRLRIRLDSDADPAPAVAAVEALGYRLVPFDPALLAASDDRRAAELLRAMAVAGFAAANVMLLSVAVWAGHGQGMGPATRDLLHWISALIALPAIVYAGRPFFASAGAALRHRHLNMDVPISLAVVLAAGMSLFETVQGGPHAYFDSSVTLLFFLLVGRYLDARARGQARSVAQNVVSLGATAVTLVDAAGRRFLLPPEEVAPGMTALVAAGERVPVDGRIVDGASEVDTALISGETVPARVAPGDTVYAGTLNLSAPLRLSVTAVGEGTLLAEIARLMEAAEQRRARYVEIADRVARFYAPAVHVLALATFVGWLALGAAWQPALLTAIAVLIVTCPCALGLAVPVVQVVASGRLLRRDVLTKSATALERLAGIDHVVFDKTGTLTEGRPELIAGDWTSDDLAAAVRLAGASTHPLARALARRCSAPVADGVREVPSAGLALDAPSGEVRLGSRRFCGVADDDAAGPELWFKGPERTVRFAFRDAPRPDAAAVIAELTARGLTVELLSGDRAATVAAVAAELGLADWRAGCTPADKVARLEALAGEGRRVCMVGDGLNDAPALAAAFVSISPATAADISQTAADVIFQGRGLGAVTEALSVARRAGRLVHQNFGLAFAYNIVTVPLAMAGFVTPLVAAIAMSASSLVVVSNALRLAGGRR